MAGQSRAKIWNRSAKGKEGGQRFGKKAFLFLLWGGGVCPRTYFKVHSLLFLPFSPPKCIVVILNSFFFFSFFVFFFLACSRKE